MADSGQRGPGRPSKCTPEVTEEVRRILLAGGFMRTAAGYLGLHEDTLDKWRRRGEIALKEADSDIDAVPAEERKYAEFFRTTRVAEATAELRAATGIQQGGQVSGGGDWRAWAWYLEHRFPDTWGGRTAVQHSGPGGGPIPVELTLGEVLNSDAARAAVQALAAALADGEPAADTDAADASEDVGELPAPAAPSDA